jgi:hypothetical protein
LATTSGAFGVFLVERHAHIGAYLPAIFNTAPARNGGIGFAVEVYASLTNLRIMVGAGPCRLLCLSAGAYQQQKKAGYNQRF